LENQAIVSIVGTEWDLMGHILEHAKHGMEFKSAKVSQYPPSSVRIHVWLQSFHGTQLLIGIAIENTPVSLHCSSCFHPISRDFVAIFDTSSS
jgi:hypothetical protein